MSGREAVELARQSGAIRLAKKPAASHGNKIAAEQPLSCTLAIYFSLTYGTPNKEAVVLNKTVLEYPDAQPRMTVRLRLMSYDGAFDCREFAFD